MRYQAVLVALIVGAAGSATAADLSGLPVPLACSGGEPFWGLTIKDGRHAVYTLDNQPSPWKVQSVGHAAQRPTTWRVIFEGKNRQAFIFDEGQQSCSDSDGDEPLAYGILLQDGEGLLRGCCNPVAK